MAVVVSDICALPEFVADGESGLIVKAGSEADLIKKLGLLIANPSLRQRLGRNARIRFNKQFSLPIFHRQLLKIFQRVVRRYALSRIRSNFRD